MNYISQLVFALTAITLVNASFATEQTTLQASSTDSPIIHQLKATNRTIPQQLPETAYPEGTAWALQLPPYTFDLEAAPTIAIKTNDPLISRLRNDSTELGELRGALRTRYDTVNWTCFVEHEYDVVVLLTHCDNSEAGNRPFLLDPKTINNDQPEIIADTQDPDHMGGTRRTSSYTITYRIIEMGEDFQIMLIAYDPIDTPKQNSAINRVKAAESLGYTELRMRNIAHWQQKPVSVSKP